MDEKNKMNPPKVSIIIPNYNHAQFLQQRIESILNQTYQDFELIILDDCSTDNSKRIIELHRSQESVSHVIYNNNNSGSPFKQWKKGIDLARGELIWIAESDDWADALFIEKMVTVFQNFSSVGIVTCFFELTNEDGQIKGNTKEWYQFLKKEDPGPYIHKGKDFLINHMLSKNMIFNASGAMFRSNLAKAIPIDFTNYKQAGDVRFWTEILLQSDICIIKETLNHWRRHEKSVSNINKKKGSNNIKEHYSIISFIIKNTKRERALTKEILNNAFKNLIERWWNEASENRRFFPSLSDIQTFRIALMVDKRFLPRLAHFIANKAIRRLTTISKKQHE